MSFNMYKCFCFYELNAWYFCPLFLIRCALINNESDTFSSEEVYQKTKIERSIENEVWEK